MTLRDCIEKIRNDSDSISAFNEAQAKQSIIEPILDLVNWNTRDYNEVKLEHGVGARRVDYALQINGVNELFIEAKKPGEDLNNHQEQLLDYSFKEGVALAILTNSISWWFYLPLKKGAWDDRKFYTIDILEQETEDIVDKFDLLLSREHIASGKAVEHAESILEHRQREEILKERLPEAWNKMIENAVSPDSLLVDLLAETAEEVCGFQPASDEILRFIHSHREKWHLSSALETPESSDGSSKNFGKKSERWMRIGNEDYELKFGCEILVTVANWLIDKGKLQDVEDAPKLKHNGRLPLVCDKIQNSRETDWKRLKNGFYIYTNLKIDDSIAQAQKLIEHCGYDPKILQLNFHHTKAKSEQPKRTRAKPEMTLDGVTYNLRYSYEILVTVANWLIDKGKLQKSDCPVKMTARSKRDTINRTPVHTATGKDFAAPQKLKNSLYIETLMSTKNAIDHSKRLLEKYGYDPEMLKIEY